MAKKGPNGHYGSNMGPNGQKGVQNRSFSKGLFEGPNRPSSHVQRVQKGKMGIWVQKGSIWGLGGVKTPLNSGNYMRGIWTPSQRVQRVQRVQPDPSQGVAIWATPS